MSTKRDLYIALLHEGMHDRAGNIVTTSLTMIDVHDLARSARTYGVKGTFVSHPSPVLRKLARTLKSHWEEGLGATYNPNRKEALEFISIVESLDEAIARIEEQSGALPLLIATSAKDGGERVSFESFRSELEKAGPPLLILFGTGWGMSDALLNRATLFLDPIKGPTPYNHLSVRSACAIILDRLLAI